MSQYPQYPHAPQSHQRPMPSTPSVATAGWALGLSLAGCCFIGNIVSAFLAFGVLRQSEETGQNHGKGLAVAAQVINALSAGVLVVTLYFGLVLGMFSTDTPSEAKAPVNADPRIVSDVGTLEPGDCLQLPSMDGRDDFDRRVSCADAHDAEVTLRIDLADGQFPGVKAIDRRARACSGRPFEEYVGTAHRNTRLEVHYFYPTEVTWRFGDRTIVCMVSDPTGPLEGSVKDSAPGSAKGSDGADKA